MLQVFSYSVTNILNLKSTVITTLQKPKCSV